MNKQFTLLYGVALRSRHAARGQIQPHRQSRSEFHGHAGGRRHARRRRTFQRHIIRARWFTAITAIGRRASVSRGCRDSSSRRPWFAAAIRFSTTKRSTTRSRSNIWSTSRPSPLRENLITSGTQVLTLQNGFPSISTITNGRRESVLQRRLRATLDSRHRNILLAELDSGFDLHRHEGNRSRSFARSQSRAARHQSAGHAEFISDSRRQQLLLRSIRREFDLQRAAGAAGASLHARPFASRRSTLSRNRSTTPAPSAAPRPSSSSRTATTPRSGGFRPSTCAIKSASFRVYELPFGEHHRYGNARLGRTRPQQLAAAEYRHLANRNARHGVSRRHGIGQWHGRKFLAARGANRRSQRGNLRRLTARVFQHRRFRHAAHWHVRQRTPRRDRRSLQIQLERVAREILPLRPARAASSGYSLGSSESFEHAELLGACPPRWAHRHSDASPAPARCAPWT